MKGKVYRRSINPSIHQPRAAPKDLISSGASKHRVFGDKLYTEIEKEKADIQDAPSKNSHSSSGISPRRCDRDLIPYVSSDLSKHQERALRGHYIYRVFRRNRINNIHVLNVHNGANIFPARPPTLHYRVMRDIFASLIVIYTVTGL